MGETAQIGLPFAGYFARGANHEAPPGYLTKDSRDWSYAPKRGKWKRRAGSAVLGDTLDGSKVEQTGLLPAKWSAKARQVLELISASLADGDATPAGIWTNESSVWGELSFRNTNGTDAWRTLGERFSSDYPVAAASNPNRFRMVPMWSENDIRFSRCVNENQRRLVCVGTRRAIENDSSIFFPNAQGTPVRWTKGYNDATTTAYSEVIFPSGHIPPLWVPNITLPAPTGNTTAPWAYKNRFLLTVVFQFEDGSWGRPFIPVAVGAVPLKTTNPDQNLCGWVGQLSSVNTEYFDYIQYNNIPKGPPGTIARAILRTLSVDATTNAQPDPKTLGVVAYIKNNTTTTLIDYGGGVTPVVDLVNIRFEDHKWPRSARGYFTFDGHVVAYGKLKANPGAIVLAPRSLGGSIYNYTDDAAAGTAGGAVAVRENQVAVTRRNELVCSFFNAGAPTYPSAPVPLGAAVTLDSAVTTLLQSVNGDTTLTYGDWKAQTVPGADGNATTDNLELTQVWMNCSSASSATLTRQNGGDAAAGSFTNVKVGMKIAETDGNGAPVTTNIPAGLTVTVVGASTITMSGNATGTANPIKVKFGWDFGDLVPGEARDFGNAYPVVLPFSKAYRDSLPVDSTAIDFTGADPGHPKYATMNWYVKNRRSVPKRAGSCMGGGEVANGAVVFYSRGIGTLTNTRGGKTNLDDDWNLAFLYGSRGTISPEFIQGNAWVARWTEFGIEVHDGMRAIIISEAVYDPGEGTGELAYEIAQSKAAAILDTDGAHGHLALSGGKLYVSYRSGAGATYPDRYLVYDFSPSLGNMGVDEVLRPDGSPYGWSCAHRVRVSCMGEVQKADGRHMFGTLEANAGATGDGRIDEFEAGTTDNGNSIVPIGYASRQLNSDGADFCVTELSTLYAKNGTGFQVGLSSDKDRGRTDYLAMPTSGGSDYELAIKTALAGMATARDCLEVVYSDDGTGAACEFSGTQVAFGRVQNTRR